MSLMRKRRKGNSRRTMNFAKREKEHHWIDQKGSDGKSLDGAITTKKKERKMRKKKTKRNSRLQ